MAAAQAKAKAQTFAQPTVAVRAAHGFDKAKAAVWADMRKPAAESKSKQIATVGVLMGAGAGLYALIAS